MKCYQNAAEMLLHAIRPLLTFIAFVYMSLLILSELCVLLDPKLNVSFCFVSNSDFIQ